MDLLLSNDTQQRLDKISQVNHYPVGLELELQVRSSQYLLDQVMYSRELSDIRISRITSSLLSSKSLTKYTSFYEKEDLACEYLSLSTAVREMSAANLANKNRSRSLECLVATLKPLHDAYSAAVAPELTQDVCIEIVQQPSELIPHSTIRDSDLTRIGMSAEYEGFVEIAYDLYAKISNPYFKLNEVAVITFLESKRKSSAPVLAQRTSGVFPASDNT